MRLAEIVVSLVGHRLSSLLHSSWIGKRVFGAALRVSARAEVVQVKVVGIGTPCTSDLPLAIVMWGARRSNSVSVAVVRAI